MQPTHHFARILFFTGLMLLLSVPFLLTMVKIAKKNPLNGKDTAAKLDGSFNQPDTIMRGEKPGTVTIII